MQILLIRFMSETHEIINERIDDIPLLIETAKRMGLVICLTSIFDAWELVGIGF